MLSLIIKAGRRGAHLPSALPAIYGELSACFSALMSPLPASLDASPVMEAASL